MLLSLWGHLFEGARVGVVTLIFIIIIKRDSRGAVIAKRLPLIKKKALN